MELVSEEELEILSKDSGIEILDAIKGIPFNEKSWIPDDCGIYILTRSDSEQYIGSTHNILVRTRHHHIKKIETIDVYLTSNIESEYLKLEKWFIHQIKPTLNIVLYQGQMKTVQINEDVHMLIAEKHIALRRKGQEKRFFEIAELLIRKGYDSTKDDIVNIEITLESENGNALTDNIKELIKYYIENIVLYPETSNEFRESLSRLEKDYKFKINIQSKFTDKDREKIENILKND